MRRRRPTAGIPPQARKRRARPSRSIGKLLLLARLVGAGEQRRRGANGQAYLKSEAVLRFAREASALAVDIVLPFIPRVTRDAIYDLVTRNRYRWFGRRDTCILLNSDRSWPS